jgi:hypothetical protein
MGTLFGFAVGYVVGARAGSQGLDEVVDALRAVRESEEFRGLLAAVVDHARGTAATMGRWLATTDPSTSEDMLERARGRAGRP